LSREASYRRAGIHQYIAQILGNLPAPEDDLEYLLFSRAINALPPNRPDFLKRSSRWPTNHRLIRILWEQLALPKQAANERLSVLHGMAFVTPYRSSCPTVVTVYDLSFVHFPDRFSSLQRLYLASQTKRSCRQSRRVITISESTKRDVHAIYGVPAGKIDVVKPGVDRRFRPLGAVEIDAFRQRTGVPHRFLLHVGTLQPRKNLPLLLEAYEQLALADVKLVLVGGMGWMYDEIFALVEARGLEDRVLFTGYVPDADLPLWYNAAELMVLPSLHEGFGMPAVEAMACGTPVVAADSSSIPEVTGTAAILFDPASPSQLADRMATVLFDGELSARMRQRGIEQASRFSWQRAGSETVAVYRKVLSAK
jgi:glycosyltransferase involved in cell wall biosynthesis